MMQNSKLLRSFVVVGILAGGTIPCLMSIARSADPPASVAAPAVEKKGNRKSDEEKAAEAAERARRMAQIEAEAKARQAALQAELEAKARAKAEKDKKDAEEAAAKAALKVITDRADGLLKLKITRAPDDVYRAVTKLATEGDRNLTEEEKFVLYVQGSQWEKLRDLIAPYPSDFPSRLYLRVLGELTAYGAPRPVMLPTDFVRLADAAPTELEDRHVGSLGRLLTYAVGKTDSRAELMAVLKKGTRRLGGDDPTRRRVTAKILAAAEFWAEAKELGLQEGDLPTGVAVEAAPAPKLADETWSQGIAALADAKLTGEDRESQLTSLYQAMAEATPQTNQARLKQLFADAARRDLALEILALIGRQSATAAAGVDFTLRTATLELQRSALQLFAERGSLDDEPLKTLANLYARNWLVEAQFTLTTYPSWLKTTAREKYQHVAVEQVVQSAPNGAWLAALAPQQWSAVRLSFARLLLVSDDIDRLVPVIREFVSRDRATAAELANAYLVAWAQKHDPNISPEAMKQFKAEGQAIVLTRAEQEQSLKQLGTLLKSLDPATRQLLDETQVVRAFDICHSKAEIYTQDHLVAVFGPIDAMPPSLILSLVDRMRLKLTTNWREIAVQRDAATHRDQDDIFQLVDAGYRQADKITTEWLAAHPDDWRMSCTAGSLLSDWAEFAYFQAVVAEKDVDRFTTYLARTAEALKRFRESAKAYAAIVPKLKRAEFELLPYRAWFYGLLGIAHDGEINLRKGVTKDGLQEIRTAMESLPGGAADVHLGLFSAMVAENVKENRIAPEMKYRYLSGAVQITGRRATTYPAEEKVQYYDSLLSEIRLQTRLDGSDKIQTKGPFGVFVTLRHTADIARESGGFGKYLQNEIRVNKNGKMEPQQVYYRDHFEEALRVALGEFFDIRAIVFADPQAGAHDLTADEIKRSELPADRQWQETPLAYLYLEAKDRPVDRLPPLEIELDFFDRDGKVVIPVPSNSLLVDISPEAAARRPASNVVVTEIVDARELTPDNEEPALKLDVVATAHGLVPDLDELIDLQNYGLPVKEIDDREGLLVRELKTEGGEMYAVSERSWTVHLDPDPLLRGAGKQIEFNFPQPTSPEIQTAFKRYEDLDPVDAAASFTLVEGEAVAEIARPNYMAWGLGAVLGLAAVGLIIAINVRNRSNGHEAAPKLFQMPRTVTPFTVAALLARIQASPRVDLPTDRRAELRDEIVALERTAFSNGSAPQTPRDLETLGRRWIDVAATHEIQQA